MGGFGREKGGAAVSTGSPSLRPGEYSRGRSVVTVLRTSIHYISCMRAFEGLQGRIVLRRPSSVNTLSQEVRQL